MRALITFLFSSIAIFAQPFSAGIKAGVPLTDFLNAAENGTFNYSAPNNRYIVGGTAELRLPLGLGIEFDALYRRLHYNGSSLPNAFTTINGAGSNWEFPLLLKYRFRFPVVRPYLDGGVAWDTLAGFERTVSQIPQPFGVLAPPPSELQKNTTMGIVLGGGVDIHAIFLHISPEIRFTRWNTAQIGDTMGLLRSNLNQAEFLVGFTF
jgi:hypothetical protein